MARAYPPTDMQETIMDPEPGEWQALRGELVSLLDQVEGRFARVAQPRTSSHEGLTQRVRNLRDQVDVAAPSGNVRHRDALRTVKRAVDRFSEREDGFSGDNGGSLQSAIAEIRNRQMSAPMAAVGRQVMELPQFAELTSLVSGLSGRLERLEGELKAQHASNGSVKEVASQVEQLTHVVELLAGAVGETGQVKRLEAQIASLARMMGEAPKVDLTAVNKRLDDVSATVGKLAELQAMQMELDIERQSQPVVAPVDHSEKLGTSMHAIEKSMRNVYDRIDAIERNTTISGGEFERLTAELASFTQAMKEKEAVPSKLVAKIDALQARIGNIESSHSDVDGLKDDIAALRDAVLANVEPRFARLETQLEALSVKFDQPRDENPGIGQIEAQLKKLMARMDETGAQLNGLAELYAAEPEPAPAPDFEKLATMVAKRTFEAAAKAAPAPVQGVTDKTIDALEQRMTALFNTAGKDTADRLARLEANLTKRAAEMAAAPAPIQPTPQPLPSQPAPLPPSAGANRLDSMLEALSTPRTMETRQSDAMPVPPDADMPLRDPGFPPAAAQALPEPAPVMRKPAPPVATAPAKPASAAPDLSAAQRPPRPQSSLDAPGNDPFAEAEQAAPRMPQPAAPASAQSTSTFVAAARRAQRAKQETVAAPSSSNSVIGRALSRVMPAPAASDAAVVPAASIAAEPPAAEKTSLFARKPKAEKAPKPPKAPKAEKPKRDIEPEMAAAPIIPQLDGAMPEAEPESFLTRYRRPLLLAATLAVVSLLALNLVAQRLNAPADPSVTAAPAVEPTPAATAPAEQKTSLLDTTVDPKSLPTEPRVISMVDGTSTGSINPASTSTFTKPVEATPMPPALLASNGTPLPATPAVVPTPTQDGDLPTGSIPAKVDVPVKFDLAPEAVGPLELRQAAADGDMHAQFEIGAIYTEGHAVPQDYKAAATWYERAAAQGFAPAQYRLGSLYEAGNGVTKDLEQAKLWYQRSADGGNRMAMHNLAALFASGQLGDQKFDTAAEWFEQAALLDMTDSQFNLGMLHARGLGVPQDMAQSYKWFSLAARGGDADAIKARDDVAKSLTADVVKQIKAEVDGFKPNPINLAANFAPIGTWSPKFNPGDAITNKDVVAKVQKALGKLGYDVGTPDGITGPKTTDAIKSFERGTGMSELGAINPRLLAVLGSQPV